MAWCKMDHVHVTATDPVKAARFFVKVMGGRLVSQQGEPGSELIDVDLGGLLVRISAKTGADANWKGLRLGLHHIALNVDDLDRITTDMKSTGAEFVLPTNTPEPGVRYAFVKSPEGVLLELTEDKNVQPGK